MHCNYIRYAENAGAGRFRSAFTLTELIVTIGIIALLLAILVPALSSAHVSARRAQDLANIRQLALSAVAYATDNEGYFPLGDRTGSSLAPNNDDLVWINSYTFDYFLGRMVDRQVGAQWSTGAPLDNKYRQPMLCRSLANYEAILDDVGLQTYANHAPNSDAGETYMGYIYWGRRNIARAGPIYNYSGNAVSPATNYVFPKKFGIKATTQTLFTCPAWGGPSYGGQFPHTGAAENLYDADYEGTPSDAVSQGMVGICVGYTDGSARFAPRSDLWAMWQGFEWIYFDHTGQ